MNAKLVITVEMTPTGPIPQLDLEGEAGPAEVALAIAAAVSVGERTLDLLIEHFRPRRPDADSLRAIYEDGLRRAPRYPARTTIKTADLT